MVEQQMLELKRISEDAYDFAVVIPKSQWCQAYAEGRR